MWAQASPAFIVGGIFSGGNNATVQSVSLAKQTFTGGTSGTVGSINVAVSSGSFAGSLALSTSGACSGVANNGNFAISGGNLITSGTQPAGPPAYTVGILATQGTSSLCQPFTVVGAGSGGAGLNLAFDDEFNGNQLEQLDPQTANSLIWSSATGGGHAAIVLPYASPINSIGMGISLSGVTSTGGTCAISAVNNQTFTVDTWTDPQHFTLWMPLSGCTMGTLAGAVASFGPWVPAIQNSCASTPCPGNLIYFNNGSEGFDSRTLTENGTQLSITTTQPAGGYIDPLGTSHTYASGHIQTWNGSSGSAFALGNGVLFDFDGQPGQGKTTGTISGMWDTYWTLGDSNIWNASSGGGEIDAAEFGPNSNCTFQSYDMATHAVSSPVGPGNAPAQNYLAAFHQFSSDLVSTSSLTWYLDKTTTAFGPFGFNNTTPQYPIIDAEVGGNGCAINATFPNVMAAKYARVYQHVTSNACYASLPAAGTLPFRGPCPASGQFPLSISSNPNTITTAATAGTVAANLTVYTNDNLNYTGALTFDNTGVCADGGVGGACTQPLAGIYPDGNTKTAAPQSPGTPIFKLSGSNIVAGRNLVATDVGLYNLPVVANEDGVVQKTNFLLAVTAPIAGIAHVQTASGTTAATMTYPIATGNGIAGYVHYNTSDGSISSITDDQANSYTLGTLTTDSGTTTAAQCFYRTNITGTQPKTITANGINNSTGQDAIVIDEYYGGVSLDGAVSNNLQTALANGGTITSGSAGGTTSATNDAIYGGTVNAGGASPNMTLGSGFTQRGAPNVYTKTEDQYPVVSSGTPIAATFTNSGGAAGNYITCALALKPGVQAVAPASIVLNPPSISIPGSATAGTALTSPASGYPHMNNASTFAGSYGFSGSGNTAGNYGNGSGVGNYGSQLCAVNSGTGAVTLFPTPPLTAGTFHCTIAATQNALTATADLTVTITALPTIASVSFYPSGSCTGTPYNSGNPASILDNAASGTNIAQACAVLSNSNICSDCTFSVTTQPSDTNLVLQSTPAPNVGVSSVNSSADGTTGNNAVITASPGASEGAGTQTGTLYMNVQSVVASTCPFNSGTATGTIGAGTNDNGGCQNAPSGTAQFATLFSSTTYTGNAHAYCNSRGGFLVIQSNGTNSATNCMPFNVPGVDYHVGCSLSVCAGAPSGAVVGKNPAVGGNLCSSTGTATYNSSNGIVSVTANNCTLDSYDFCSNGGGVSVYVTGNVTGTIISNSYFCDNTHEIQQGGGGHIIAVCEGGIGNCGFAGPNTSDITLSADEMNGNITLGSGNTYGALSAFYYDGSGGATVKYSYCHNVALHCYRASWQKVTTGAKQLVFDYNIDYQFCAANVGAGTHCEDHYWASASNEIGADESFSAFLITSGGTVALTGIYNYGPNVPCGCTYQLWNVSNNIYMNLTGQGSLSGPGAGCNASSCDPIITLANANTWSSNYIDNGTGASYYTSPPLCQSINCTGGSAFGGTSWYKAFSGNKKMTTGGQCGASYFSNGTGTISSGDGGSC